MGGNIPRPAGTPFTTTALSAGKGGINNEEILLGHDKIISEVTVNKNWMGTSVTLALAENNLHYYSKINGDEGLRIIIDNISGEVIDIIYSTTVNIFKDEVTKILKKHLDIE